MKQVVICCLVLLSCIICRITPNSIGMYSFIVLTYRQKLAAMSLYLRVRHFYPKAPIFFLIDQKGENLSEFCHTDPYCKIKISDIRFGHDWQNGNNSIVKPSTIVKIKLSSDILKKQHFGEIELFLFI
jgi:hypothetical protein